jgi:hypothetical protein
MNTKEITAIEEDCYIVDFKPNCSKRKLLYKKGFVVYATEFDEDEDFEIIKVLPRGTTYRKVFKTEKLENKCFGCDCENSQVNWVQNSEHEFFELKNSCEECFASGNLIGDDFP